MLRNRRILSFNFRLGTRSPARLDRLRPETASANTSACRAHIATVQQRLEIPRNRRLADTQFARDPSLNSTTQTVKPPHQPDNVQAAKCGHIPAKAVVAVAPARASPYLIKCSECGPITHFRLLSRLLQALRFAAVHKPCSLLYANSLRIFDFRTLDLCLHVRW